MGQLLLILVVLGVAAAGAFCVILLAEYAAREIRVPHSRLGDSAADLLGGPDQSEDAIANAAGPMDGAA